MQVLEVIINGTVVENRALRNADPSHAHSHHCQIKKSVWYRSSHAITKTIIVKGCHGSTFLELEFRDSDGLPTHTGRVTIEPKLE